VITADPPRARRTAGGLLLSIAACEGVAVAVWLIPASVHIVEWPPSGPVRLALLSPAWLLPLLIVAGAAAAIATASRVTPAEIRPLLAFWLWVVPFLPWLPDRAPLLLVLAGPLRWVIAGLAIGAATVRRIAPDLRRVRLRLDAAGVFLLTLAIYLVLGLASARANGPRGDEPHYLIITSSLLNDGDLRIENNHKLGEYRAFYADALPPDYLKRGADGQIYSIHAPGLAALLLPAYAVAGYFGTVVFMCLIGALAAAVVFAVSEALSGREAALLTWAAVCLTVPFLPHAWLLFPEMAAALLVAWAVLWMVRRDRATDALWFTRGAALSMLPWLHTKFAVLLALFGGALALRVVQLKPDATKSLIGRNRTLVAFLVPIAASGALWLYFFYTIYGVLDPQVPYGGFARQFVRNRNILHGVVGFFFDRSFGLLVYSPVYFASIAGVWLAARRREIRWTALFLVAAVGAFVIASARFYMFWGGASAPARFLVPVLPCLAPFLAMVFAGGRDTAWRGPAIAALAVSLVFAAAGVLLPARLMLFSEPHGRARLLDAIGGPSPLALTLPSFTEPDWYSQLPQLIPWTLAFGAALVCAVVAVLSRRASATAIATTAGFVLVAAVTTARPSAAVREAVAARGIAAALPALDRDSMETLDYARLRRADDVRVRELTTLSPTPRERGEDYAAAPAAVAAGRYEVQIWFNTLQPREGHIFVTASRALLAETSGSLTNPATLPVELPVPTRNFTVRIADKAVGASVSAVRLVPLGPPAGGSRSGIDVQAIESLPGRKHAYIVYGDEHTFPEGGTFWTRGTRRARLWIAPAGAARMRISLSTGPLAGDVLLKTSVGSRKVQVPAGRPEQVTFDLPEGSALVPLEVQSTTVFLPTDGDSQSRDIRPLGCRVEIALE
jgi:hypothetical protein